MSRQDSWQKEESRIFLRDLFFLLLIIFFSIFIAEQLLLKEDATLVDRVFAYLLIFIPLGTINLIAHYVYRNRRIRVTGNLRTSLRYRLSLAFMLVSIIPSIPIFLISSNVVEELVKGIFRVDATAALESANRVLQYYKNQESAGFLHSIEENRPELFRRRKADKKIIARLYADKVLTPARDYAAFYVDGRISYETRRLLSRGDLPMFKETAGGSFLKAEASLLNKDFIFYRFPLVDNGKYLILGRQLHPGIEKDYRIFSPVYKRFRKQSVWREKITSTLRLGLGLIYIFMIGFALIMALVISRQLSMPIVSLAQATRDITDGKLDTELDIQAQGEMGILIESFNQMTAELRSLRTQLLHSQRVAAWQEVARRLAHEIKNPLTPIQLSAERMIRRLEHPEKGNLNKIVRSGAATIVEQVNVLKHLVKEFADFARLPAARPEPQSLDRIVTEAVNLFRGTADVGIHMELDQNLPDFPIDKTIMMGMINNLIKNAIEAIKTVPEEGRTAPRIRISTGLQRRGIRQFVMLKVEDNGPGIDDELRDRVFEPYFTTKGEHGSGLGLALVERAVLDHDARIFVGRSALGGAEFTILFRIRG